MSMKEADAPEAQEQAAGTLEEGKPILIPLAGEKTKPRRDDVTGDVSEDSEPDFVDVHDIKPHESETTPSQRPERFVNSALASNCDDALKPATARSSLKLPVSAETPPREKRSISFDLHDQRQMQAGPQVTLEEPNDSKLRHLFAKSRWSASSSSSEDETARKKEGKKDSVIIQLNDVTTSPTSLNPTDALLTKEALRAAAIKKSYSLQPHYRRKRSTEEAHKKRRSTGDDVIGHNASLRDSAIDLVSDDDNNSEVYTAVSLAGTLSRNMQPVPSEKNKRKYVIIGVVAGFIVAVTIIVALLVLLLTKH